MEFVKELMFSEYMAVLTYFPLCMLGLMLHFLKKKVKTENFHEVQEYFTKHRVSTLTSILTAIALLYIFDAMGQLNVVSAILSGYATDSLFQKQVDAMVMRDPTTLNQPGVPGVTPPTTGMPPAPTITAGEDEPEEGA